jgi:hypothetical protein
MPSVAGDGRIVYSTAPLHVAKTSRALRPSVDSLRPRSLGRGAAADQWGGCRDLPRLVARWLAGGVFAVGRPNVGVGQGSTHCASSMAMAPATGSSPTAGNGMPALASERNQYRLQRSGGIPMPIPSSTSSTQSMSKAGSESPEPGALARRNPGRGRQLHVEREQRKRLDIGANVVMDLYFGAASVAFMNAAGPPCHRTASWSCTSSRHPYERAVLEIWLATPDGLFRSKLMEMPYAAEVPARPSCMSTQWVWPVVAACAVAGCGSDSSAPNLRDRGRHRAASRPRRP